MAFPLRVLSNFVPPVETDPCPIITGSENYGYGPIYGFDNTGFKIPVLPGNYRLHGMYNLGGGSGLVSLGIVPISVTAGQMLDLTTASVNVPIGQNVQVSLGGITVIFPEVIISGFMSVITTTHPQGGQPPSQYRFLGTYYELTTSATYIGPVTVQFTYDDAEVRGREENLKLFHWDGTRWRDITISVDTINNIITGVTPTLSPFVIGDLQNEAPSVDAGGPYQINEGDSIQVSASGQDPESGPLTYAWDLDNNGSFETPGQNVTFSASSLGPGVYTITVQVTDNGNLTVSDQTTVTVVRRLTALAPAQVWVGLKNSDDVGTRFDLLAEAYKDGDLIISGQLDNVWGGSSGFNNARLNTINFNSFSPVDFPQGSTLGIKLYVRNACQGPTHNSGTARLWFNDGAANSHFGATIGTATNNYFILNNFLLGTSAGAGPKKTIDVAAGSPCSPFKLFGTWIVSL